MDIKESYRGWHDKIGYIPQTIYMLDDTIRNNIAFGKVKVLMMLKYGDLKTGTAG